MMNNDLDHARPLARSLARSLARPFAHWGPSLFGEEGFFGVKWGLSGICSRWSESAIRLKDINEIFKRDYCDDVVTPSTPKKEAV